MYSELLVGNTNKSYPAPCVIYCNRCEIVEQSEWGKTQQTWKAFCDFGEVSSCVPLKLSIRLMDQYCCWIVEKRVMFRHVQLHCAKILGVGNPAVCISCLHLEELGFKINLTHFKSHIDSIFVTSLSNNTSYCKYILLHVDQVSLIKWSWLKS